MTPVEILASVLMLAGALLTLLAAVGMLVLPDVLARLQAATKPQVLGLILIGAATALLFDTIGDRALLLLAVLFQLATAPVLAQIVGRAAYRAGAVDPDHLVVDDLADSGRQGDGDETKGAG